MVMVQKWKPSYSAGCFATWAWSVNVDFLEQKSLEIKKKERDIKGY